jgi:acyl carrier protein
MSMDALSEKVREIIAVELQVDESRVVPMASLRADLGMDSIAALNILFAAEEAFGLAAIDVKSLAGIVTVAEVEAFLRARVVAQAS